MTTSERQFVIGEKEIAQISGYYEIAKANKSIITVSELLDLTATDATEQDVLDAWDDNEALRSRYFVESGYIVEKGESDRLGGSRISAEDSNRERARKNLSAARDFAGIFSDDRIRLLAISGGNSYKSARKGDDIDFFCVTAESSLWLFMLKSLVLARLYKFTRKTAPFCFSYVMDERRALAEFAEAGDGLFARDALSAEVLTGRKFYLKLLFEAKWIQGFFPRMYMRKVAEAEELCLPGGRRKGNSVINLFLYNTVGTYVRMKAHLLNRKYRAKGNDQSLFKVRIGLDHCIYESNRYKGLRGMYPRAGAESCVATMPLQNPQSGSS